MSEVASQSPGDHSSPHEPPSHRGAVSLAVRVAAAPLWLRGVACILLLGLVALIDEITGGELSFSVFYLIPVLFAGVFISRSTGRVTAVAGAAVWGYLEVVERLYSAAWIPVWNSGVRLLFFLAINELVQIVRAAHVRERELSRRDALTGIANVRVFSERVAQAIAQAQRDGRPFTLAYTDLDRFKSVNDTHGHSEGDALLRAVAQAMERDLRANDLVARLGGDEFGILLATADAAGARTTLGRISASLAREAGERWGVGATFGAVTFVQPPPDVDAAVQIADDLMYRGKSQGRGTILYLTWPAEDAEAP